MKPKADGAPAMRFVRRARRTVYSNPWIRFEAHDIIHPNGTPGEHGMVVTPAASAVVVYGAGRVFFTRQARFAVDREMLEIVKGGAHAGESALDAARRETREEIGVVAARWDPLGSAYEVPSLLGLPVALFLARDLTHVGSNLEHVESIDTVTVDWDEALAAARDGTLEDAISALAVLRCAALFAREGGA